METEKLFIDVAYHSLNKKEEELCGDKVEIFKSEDRTIIVLADGLGSGVKANILATLTSKIAITMLKKGARLEEVIETIAYTLPVCKVRKIAYSTFSIIEIDEKLHCKIFESENPPFFFVRRGHIIEPPKTKVKIMDKTVVMTDILLQEEDTIYLCSDGVIHAGVGQELNFGWQWHHVAKYVEKKPEWNAELLSQRLLGACDELYAKKPGDDTTVVTVKVRKPLHLFLFTGPPLKKEWDHAFAKQFIKKKGTKVVCGGTAAGIISRELDREIRTQIDYIDPKIPPIAYIEGIDLVTEGVITLQGTIRLLLAYQKGHLQWNQVGEDGASRLFRLLLEDSTHIDIWLGKALNSAHQAPDFPQELSMKITLVKTLVDSLKQLGKSADIHYISEVNHEKV